MSDALRRQRYQGSRVLIDTERVLDSQFKATLLYVTGAQVEMLRNLMAYLNREATFVSEYNEGYYLTPTVGDWDSLQAIVASLEDMLMEVTLGFYDAYVRVSDYKSVGVAGGTFTSGGWRVRDINTENADTAEICAVLDNQITLPEGTYRCLISAPAYGVGSHQARLWNVEDTVGPVLGVVAQSEVASPTVTHALLVGRFTLDDEKTLEIQHRCASTKATNGFGVSAGWWIEVYTVAEFWREA